MNRRAKSLEFVVPGTESKFNAEDEIPFDLEEIDPSSYLPEDAMIVGT